VTCQIVDLLHAAGLEAYRVPRFKCDVELRIGNKVIAIESKMRSKGFGWFYKWLLTADGLVIKADRKPMLVVLPLEKFSTLLGECASATETSAHKPLAQPSPQQAGPNNQQRTLRRAFLLLPTIEN